MRSIDLVRVLKLATYSETSTAIVSLFDEATKLDKISGYAYNQWDLLHEWIAKSVASNINDFIAHKLV